MCRPHVSLAALSGPDWAGHSPTLHATAHPPVAARSRRPAEGRAAPFSFLKAELLRAGCTPPRPADRRAVRCRQQQHAEDTQQQLSMCYSEVSRTAEIKEVTIRSRPVPIPRCTRVMVYFSPSMCIIKRQAAQLS